MNSPRSSRPTWFSMNSFTGWAEALKACGSSILWSSSGLIPAWYEVWKVGAMIRAVRNRARLTSTALGGLCCKPSAVRNKDSTTVMRTNEVVMITIEGASDSTVIRPTSCTTRSVRPAPEPRFRLIAAAPPPAAA